MTTESERAYWRARAVVTRASWTEEKRALQRSAVRKYHYTKGRYKKHGITREDYNRLLEEQRGCCATCDRPEEEARGGTLMIDHDHKTGEVRALLCHNCNVVLGLVSDRISVLARLIVLLEEKT